MTSPFNKMILAGTFSLMAAGWVFAGGAKGRAIEYSEPRNERGITNGTFVSPGQNSLDRMEADLNGPLKTILKGNSLEGMMMPMPQMVPPPMLQPVRNREQMERRRDQMYLSPEDLYSVKSIEDAYKAPELTSDGRKVKDLRPMERWIMQTIESGSGGGTNQPNGGPVTGSAFMDGKDGLGTVNGRPDYLKKELLKVFHLDADSVAKERASSELFGLGTGFGQEQKVSPAEMQRRDAFMEMMDPNYAKTPEDVARSGGAFATPYVNSSFYDPPKQVVAPASTAFTSPSTVAAPAADLWKSSFVQPPPAPKPVAPPAPTTPFINIPHREF